MTSPPTEHTAVVAGATGAVATRLVEHLSKFGWTVVGLCRSPPAAQSQVRFISTDLLDANSVRTALSGVPNVSHVFYAARAKFGEGGTESVADNVAMLRHLLDAANVHADTLEHIHLVEGGKWYGQHLGCYPTPAREDDPRHMPPNFYYEQEDLLRERQDGQAWTWSASRPNAVCDFAPGRARNIVSIVGAYAAICRELGLRLDYPGHPLQFRALTEVTDATHLARAITFLATAPSAANTAFNVTNGDVFRWERLWPRIAELFGLEVGIVRMMSLADMMRDKEDVWAEIVRKRNLEPRRLADIAQWSFADVLLRQTFDVVSSTTKLRRAGFSEIVDTEEMFLAHLARYREARIIG